MVVKSEDVDVAALEARVLLDELKERGIDELYVQSMLLSKVIRRTLKIRGDLQLSSEPFLERVSIVEFMKRMRIWSLEKFDTTTYISVINFYRSDEDMAHNKVLGAIVVYIGEQYVSDLLKRLGYPEPDDDDPEALEDACGTFCNIVAAKFKSGLIQLGYTEPVMSHFKSYRDEVINGVEFDIKQTEKYELSFEIKGDRRIMIDLTMGHLLKKR